MKSTKSLALVWEGWCGVVMLISTSAYFAPPSRLFFIDGRASESELVFFLSEPFRGGRESFGIELLI